MGLMLTTNADMVAGVLRAEGTDPDAVMRAIAATRSLAMVVDDTLRALVAQARASGRTWAEIGGVLNVSRQAAFQRFGASSGDGEPGDGEGIGRAARPVPGARKRALAVVRAFLDRRWETVRAGFDERMTNACSEALLSSVHASLLAELGDLETVGTPAITTHRGYTVTDTPLAYARGGRTVRVVFDADGRVSGFFVLPDDGER
jgi:hypothetical protein